MNRPLKFLIILSLLYNVLSTTRCVNLQYRYWTATDTLIKVCESSSTIASDINDFKDTVESIKIKDGDRRYKIVYLTKIVYVPTRVLTPAHDSIEHTGTIYNGSLLQGSIGRDTMEPLANNK